MNYTRSELINAEATMNQIRNAIYHLARYMVKNNVKNLNERLRRMGKNIAKTYIAYWKPIEEVSLLNVKDVISTIYKQILNSSVIIEINERENLLIVKDNNCALCKYHYNDIEIAGCEILLGLISEFINLINKNSNNSSAIALSPARIQESKALGNEMCVQLFNYEIRGA
ncbi:MAG: hypothetical protein P8Y70_12590 [Candidatus Lokiarchaeota archaeon]